MNSGQMIGWIGGALGVLIGLIGGVVGTWCSIRNTGGPRERGFMVRAAAVCWILGLLFIVLLCTLPDPYRHLLWILYAILLPAGIIYGNRRQRRIREEEARPGRPDQA